MSRQRFAAAMVVGAFAGLLIGVAFASTAPERDGVTPLTIAPPVPITLPRVLR